MSLSNYSECNSDFQKDHLNNVCLDQQESKDELKAEDSRNYNVNFRSRKGRIKGNTRFKSRGSYR